MTNLINPKFIGDELIAEILEAKPDLDSGLGPNFNPTAQVAPASLPVTVHYLSDNGNYADTAKIEIRKRLSDINAVVSTLTRQQAPETNYYDTPAQDWRAGAFDLAQISRDTIRGVGNVIFLNCAPRRKERGNKTDNEGEGVYIGMLRNGTIVSAVSEDSFALFRDLIEEGDLEIYRAGVQIKGSQFRSRDYFPWLSQLIAFNLQNHAADWKAGLSVEERRAFLENLAFVETDKVLGLEEIFDFKKQPCVLRADTHGNLKLSLREEDVEGLDFNTPVNIFIKKPDGTEIERQAILKQGMFDPNDISPVGLAKGSSGHWPDSKQGRFLELALMGKSLRDTFAINDQDLKEGVRIQIQLPANTNRADADFTPATVGAEPINAAI